jgi:hypothetical protein
MKRIFLAIAALALSACGVEITPPGSAPAPATAPVITEPLRSTNIDEQGVKLAFDAFDTALTAIDGLMAAGVVKPGSERALLVREYVFRVKAALNAAASAQRAGNAESYRQALADARAAYGAIQDLLKGIK